MDKNKFTGFAFIVASLLQGNAFAVDMTEFSVRGISLNQQKETVDAQLTAEYGDETTIKKTVPDSKLFNVSPYRCRETRRNWQCKADFGERDPNGGIIRTEYISANFNKAGNLYSVQFETRTNVADSFDGCWAEVNSIVSSLTEKHGAPTQQYPIKHKIASLSMEKGVQLQWHDGSKRPAERYMMNIGCHKSGNMGISSTLQSEIIMKAAMKKKATTSVRY